MVISHSYRQGNEVTSTEPAAADIISKQLHGNCRVYIFYNLLCWQNASEVTNALQLLIGTGPNRFLE